MLLAATALIADFVLHLRLKEPRRHAVADWLSERDRFQALCRVFHAGPTPCRIGEYKSPTVCALYESSTLEHECVRNENGTLDAVVGRKEHGGQNVEPFVWQATKGTENSGFVVLGPATPLDLNQLLSIVCRGVSVWVRRLRPLPPVSLAKEILSEVTRGIVRASNDLALAQFLGDPRVKCEQFRRCKSLNLHASLLL